MFNQVIDIALKSLMYEVAATPKPGLVDRNGNGAHNDMDYFSFIDSTIAMRTYFIDIYDAIKAMYLNNSEVLLDASVVFEQLKPIGMKAERTMLNATNGVNTHKGAIYALGLLVAATLEIEFTTGIHSIFGDERITIVTNRVGEYVTPHLEKEFLLNHKLESYGYKQYMTLGLLGARGEAASGFYHAKVIGLPLFESCLKKGFSLNDSMIHTLLMLITHVEDSNVIGRRDLSILKQSQAIANDIIKLGAMKTSSGQIALKEYCDWCVIENISHGGSADLLVVTLFLYQLKNKIDGKI